MRTRTVLALFPGLSLLALCPGLLELWSADTGEVIQTQLPAELLASEAPPIGERDFYQLSDGNDTWERDPELPELFDRVAALIGAKGARITRRACLRAYPTLAT